MPKIGQKRVFVKCLNMILANVTSVSRQVTSIERTSTLLKTLPKKAVDVYILAALVIQHIFMNSISILCASSSF